jgi:hypothetical protein
MVKRLSVISVLAMLLVVILLLAPGSACDQGAKQAEVPAGPPSVTSFKLASQYASEDQAPLFTWEAANASSVTITQYGEVVYHIEAVPDTESSAFLSPLHDKAYASSASEYEMKQPYNPGIYPVGFKGASNGKPLYASTTSKDFWTQKGNVWRCNYEGASNFGDKGWWDSHCYYIDLAQQHSFVTLGGDVRSIWKFGDTKEGEHQAIVTDAVMDVLSPDGQLVTTEIPVAVVQEGDPLAPPAQPLITPPPCVRAGSSTPIIPVIKRWAVRNPVVQDGEAPQFEFEVTNPHIISIRHGDEYISSVEIINPPLTSSISLPSFIDKVQASTTSEYEYKQPYSPGIFPVGFGGNDNNKPSKIAWKFGEKSREDSAEITVCSPTGDIVSATVTFTIMRVVEQAPAVPQPPLITFTASRNIVAPMDPVTFTWNVTGDDLTVKLVSDGNQRTVPPSGSESIIIMKSACYYIMAENPAGRASQQQCVTVQSSGFIPPPVYIEPPCPPETAPPLWAPPSAPPTVPPPVAPLTDGY